LEASEEAAAPAASIAGSGHAPAPLRRDYVLLKSMPRPRACGKFLYVGEEKFFARGVTYGPFGADGSAQEYGHLEQVERDFAAIRSLGANCIRTYTVPPRWLLDCAQRHGLYVMVGLPWEQHVAFLDDPQAGAGHRQARPRGHPSL
jgi:hypothetical protein